MAIFGKNGFIRQQEVAFAKKLIVWKYQQAARALPDDSIITAHAQKVVEEAHLIAKKSGRNVLEVLKQSIKEMNNKRKP